MKLLKILLALVLLSVSFAQFEYSLKDQNDTSPTFNEYVWHPIFSDYITVHFFSTQG